jgi:hypothetical protein
MRLLGYGGDPISGGLNRGSLDLVAPGCDDANPGSRGRTERPPVPRRKRQHNEELCSERLRGTDHEVY